MSNVLTGAIALVKVNGTVIGRMKGIRFSENFGRQDVKGIGTIYKVEAPVVDHAGTLSCDFYEIDFTQSGVPGALRRDVQTKQEFEDNLVLDGSIGVQIDVFKKVEDVIDPVTLKKRAKLDPYAVITRCLIETDGIDITEGAISGRSQTFRFLDPILMRS